MKYVSPAILLLLFQMSFAQSISYPDVFSEYSNKLFNGVVVIGTDSTVDEIRAIGIANRSTGKAFTTVSRFRIASMTKAFTAVLIMKLVEEGKIDLNHPFAEYFPAYKGEAGSKATIHHLLTYSSGIYNQLDSSGMEPYSKKHSLDEFIDLYCSGKLVNTPGEKSVYGNTEYIILQKIIGSVTGQTFETFLGKVILKPLKLRDTGFAKKQLIGKTLVPSYSYNDSLKVFQMDEPYFIENFFASGDLYSTAEDLFRFYSAIFSNKLLKPQTTTQLLTIHDKLGYAAYGIWGSPGGWGSFKEPFYYRTGGILGATSNWIYTVNSKKTILVLSNTDATNLYEFSEQLYRVGLKRD